MKNNKGFGVIGIILIIVGIFVVGGGYTYFRNGGPKVPADKNIIQDQSQNDKFVTNFNECIEAGNPAMESYPRQCRHGDQTFTEFIKDIPCDGPSDLCLKEIICDDGFKTEEIEVCGKINVQCIKAPCYPVDETFINRCEARDRGAFDIRIGSCDLYPNNYLSNDLRKEGETCGQDIGKCEVGLKCAYPCGIEGCENICLPENEPPRP